MNFLASFIGIFWQYIKRAFMTYFSQPRQHIYTWGPFSSEWRLAGLCKFKYLDLFTRSYRKKNYQSNNHSSCLERERRLVGLNVNRLQHLNWFISPLSSELNQGWEMCTATKMNIKHQIYKCITITG